MKIINILLIVVGGAMCFIAGMYFNHFFFENYRYKPIPLLTEHDSILDLSQVELPEDLCQGDKTMEKEIERLQLVEQMYILKEEVRQKQIDLKFKGL